MFSAFVAEQAAFLYDLIGNTEDWFSRVEAHLIFNSINFPLQIIFYFILFLNIKSGV